MPVPAAVPLLSPAVKYILGTLGVAALMGLGGYGAEQLTRGGKTVRKARSRLAAESEYAKRRALGTLVESEQVRKSQKALRKNVLNLTPTEEWVIESLIAGGPSLAAVGITTGEGTPAQTMALLDELSGVPGFGARIQTASRVRPSARSIRLPDLREGSVHDLEALLAGA